MSDDANEKRATARSAFQAMVSEIEKDMPPCKYCGRCVLAGPPCCWRKGQDILDLAIKERDHARKLQGREARNAAKWLKAYQETNAIIETMDVRMKAIAEAAIEAVKNTRCNCHYAWTSRGQHDPSGCAWEALSEVRALVEKL